MKRPLVWLLIYFISIPGFALDLQGRWSLEKSEITYTVTHPLHVVRGKSLTAKGKGVCYSGHYDFHVGVLVNSFDSGDKNRDLHMLQVTKAALFPLIDVKAELVKNNGRITIPGQLTADVTIQFAGKTVKYPKVKLDLSEWKPGGVRLWATLTLRLKDFEIQPPSLLTMPVQDEVPVKLDMFWKRVNVKEMKK